MTEVIESEQVHTEVGESPLSHSRVSPSKRKSMSLVNMSNISEEMTSPDLCKVNTLFKRVKDGDSMQ